MENITLLTAVSFSCAIIFALISQICFMLAIGYDCKAKGVESRKKYMVLCFFFPLIAGIIYFCKLKQYKENAAKLDIPDREGCNKKRKTALIFAIIALILCNAAAFAAGFFFAEKLSDDTVIENIIENNGDRSDANDAAQEETDPAGNDYAAYDPEMRFAFTENGQKIFYDMKGDTYDRSDKVPFYYCEDGKPYTLSIEDDFSIYLVNGENKYLYFDSYVTADGFFVYDGDASFKANDDQISYTTDDGKICYAAMDVSWNAAGDMIDIGGKLLMPKTE